MNDNEVCAKFAHTTEHGAIQGKTQTRELDYYNLDMIISVGYKVNSKQGIALIKYLLLDKELQTALEKDIPNVIKLNSTYEKMKSDNIKIDNLRYEEFDYMLDFVDEVDLLELNINEFFILFNDKIKEFMEQNEEFKKYLTSE